MTHLNILIVEDESIVAMEIESYISTLGCKVLDIASSAEEAYQSIEKKPPELILMDIYLKGEIDGIVAAAQIKKRYPQIEIIFLSANKDEFNIDRAIEVNPVSYMSKPFNRQELLAALKMAKNKIANAASQDLTLQEEIMFDDEFRYNTRTKMLYCCLEFIHMTKKETLLLDLFMEKSNTIIDLQTIEQRIWPDTFVNSNTVRTLIRRLRTKLKQRFIETLSTQGYIFNIHTEKEQTDA